MSICLLVSLILAVSAARVEVEHHNSGGKSGIGDITEEDDDEDDGDALSDALDEEDEDDDDDGDDSGDEDNDSSASKEEEEEKGSSSSSKKSKKAEKKKKKSKKMTPRSERIRAQKSLDIQREILAQSVAERDAALRDLEQAIQVEARRERLKQEEIEQLKRELKRLNGLERERLERERLEQVKQVRIEQLEREVERQSSVTRAGDAEKKEDDLYNAMATVAGGPITVRMLKEHYGKRLVQKKTGLSVLSVPHLLAVAGIPDTTQEDLDKDLTKEMFKIFLKVLNEVGDMLRDQADNAPRIQATSVDPVGTMLRLPEDLAPRIQATSVDPDQEDDLYNAMATVAGQSMTVGMLKRDYEKRLDDHGLSVPDIVADAVPKLLRPLVATTLQVAGIPATTQEDLDKDLTKEMSKIFLEVLNAVGAMLKMVAAGTW